MQSLQQLCFRIRADGTRQSRRCQWLDRAKYINAINTLVAEADHYTESADPKAALNRYSKRLISTPSISALQAYSRVQNRR